jgi:hypothetical protein
VAGVTPKHAHRERGSTRLSAARNARSGRVEGRSLDLAPQHGHFVAKCQQLGLLGAIGAGEEDDELEEMADGEVSEGPELAACPLPTHRRGR